MKYSEFREYLKRNGITFREDEEKLIVDDQFGISKTEEYSTWFSLGFVEFPYECEMLKKAFELAETPLDEREGEEKKYYLRLKCLDKYTNEKYINLAITGKVEIKDRHEDQLFKTKFTKAEVEEFKERFDITLNDFELIEVED